MITRAAIYVRSGPGEGVSADNVPIAAQTRECQRFIATQGPTWKVVSDAWSGDPFFAERRGGADPERPALTRLLKLASQGEVDAIVLFRLDCLATDEALRTSIISQLTEHRVLVCSTVDGPQVLPASKDASSTAKPGGAPSPVAEDARAMAGGDDATLRRTP